MQTGYLIFVLSVHLPEFLEDPLFSDHGISIYRQSGKIYRAFYDYSDQNKIYAVTDYSNEEKVIQVNYLPNKEKYFSESGNCFFHIGLEALMMKLNATFCTHHVYRLNMEEFFFQVRQDLENPHRQNYGVAVKRQK